MAQKNLGHFSRSGLTIFERERKETLGFGLDADCNEKSPFISEQV